MMGEQARGYERLQAALDIVDSLVQEPDATCSILGAKADEALVVGTKDGYLIVARILLSFVLKVTCGVGPLEDLEMEALEGAGQPYATCDIKRAFACTGPYRQLVTPVSAYLADDEGGRRGIEALFEAL